MLPIIDQRGEYSASQYFSHVYQASREELERVTDVPTNERVSPQSIGVYEHLGQNQAEADRIVAQLQAAGARYQREWEQAGERPTNGGGCYYRPVAILLSNYDASIESDRRTCRVSSAAHLAAS